MSLLNFRDQFLTRVTARLGEINVATATDAELLVAGALMKQLDAANRVDLLSLDALALLASLSGADLDAYALDPAGRVQVQAIFADTRTATAVVLNATAMANIAASTQWVTLLQLDAGAIALAVANPVAMDALSASTIARGVIGRSGALYTAITSSATASGKYLAGVAGLNPASIADINALAASAGAMDAVAGNATAHSMIGTAGVLYDAIKTSSVASAKMLAAHAGLVPSTYADMTALAANSAAMTSVIASTPAMNFAKNSTACITGFLSNYTARGQLWASSSARATLIGNAFSRDRLIASASSYTSYQSSSNNLLLKKGWMLSVVPWPGDTSGSANYKYINDEGAWNNATNAAASFSYTSASPFYTYAGIAKCGWLTAENSLSPLPYATYVYLQMEA